MTAGYGPVTVLRGVDFRARPGRGHLRHGPQWGGQVDLMKCLMGLVPATGSTITAGRGALQGLPAHQVPRHGLGLCAAGPPPVRTFDCGRKS
jgi:branched-chain amino acid transport system ATP-binding protein